MIDGPVRMRTYLTSGQKADALADADAPNVPDFVADGAIDDDGVVDAVLLPDTVRVAVMLTEPELDVEALRLPVMPPDRVRDRETVKAPELDVEMLRLPVLVTDGAQLLDIVRDAVAPIVSEPVDVDVCVAVSELDGVVETEMLKEGDAAHHTGIDG
jgi:hypothetical protein